MSSKTFKVASLHYKLEVVGESLKVGCQTITKKDALAIARFINEADFTVEEPTLEAGTKFIPKGDKRYFGPYVLCKFDGQWALVTDSGYSRCGLRPIPESGKLTLSYINSFSEIPVEVK